MSVISHSRWRLTIPIALTLLALIAALVFTFLLKGPTHAAGSQQSQSLQQSSGFTQAAGKTESEPLLQISSDPYNDPLAQHKTEVEPDTFAFGHTVVAVFQVARIFDGGSDNIGFATSTNAGNANETFVHGFLRGTTGVATPPGIYQRVSDPSVAFDAKHNVWLISFLGLFPHGNTSEVDVLVSRSTDGGLHWGLPVAVNTTGQFNDKNWTTCDDTPSSPFYGNCYTEFDNATVGDLIENSTSSDGGLSWGAEKQTANKDFGIGGQPLVQPNGTVIVPIVGFTVSANQPFDQKSYISKNGGQSWSSTFLVSKDPIHVPQGIRATIPLPSAEIDASGKVYSVWQDCRFEPGCFLNDLVLSTTTDGIHWTQPKLVPIDPVNSHVDHFIPGLAVDRSTSGGSAHLALTFYEFADVNGVTGNCQTATCQLEVGFIDSKNGGQSWSSTEILAGPMFLQWLAVTNQGYMVGDYISTSIVPGSDDATSAFEIATPPTGFSKSSLCVSAGVVCHESTFTTPEELLTGGTNAAGDPTASFPTDGPQSQPIAPKAI